jgi:hypothetical protein
VDVAALALISLGVGVILVAGLGNSLVTASSASSQKANATPTATSAPVRASGTPSAPASSVGACPPSSCADDNGWIVRVGNVRYDIQSGNEFQKPQAGHVYLALDVTFTNKPKQERLAPPLDFVLIDGSGHEQQITFIDTCAAWSREYVAPGASYGPKCLAFEAVAGKPSGLVLVWTPNEGSRVYKIKVT